MKKNCTIIRRSINQKLLGVLRQNSLAVFDGQNDVLSALYRDGGYAAMDGFCAGRDGTIDIDRAKRGGFAGGFFAIYVPSSGDKAARRALMVGTSYAVPLPEPLDWEDAYPVVMAQASILYRLEEQGALRICRTTADIHAAMAAGVMAAVLHIEGAEAIDRDLITLDVLYQAGLRSLGPV